MGDGSDAERSGGTSSSSALELLAQYEQHIMERGRTLEAIEGHGGERLGPTYEELVEENVQLRRELQGQREEIEHLRKTISLLASGRSGATVVEQQVRPEPSPSVRELALPPRSADRRKNTKNLSLAPVGHEVPSTDRLRVSPQEATSGAQQVPLLTSSKSAEILVSKSPDEDRHLMSPRKTISRSSSSYSNTLGSPATSVLYKNSRISITSPCKSNSTSKAASVLSLPENNTSTENAPHSPHRIDNELDLLTVEPQDGSRYDTERAGGPGPLSPESIVYSDSDLQEHQPSDLSSTTRTDLGKFRDMVDTTFNAEDNPTGSRDKETGTEMEIATLQNTPSRQHESSLVTSPQASRSSITTPVVDPTNTSEPSSLSAAKFGSMSTATSSNKRSKGMGTPSVEHSAKSYSQHSGSPHSNSHQSKKADIPLFVQPEELGTIRIEVISTLYHEPGNAASILFSVVDKKSSKEMFKFAKTFTRIAEFDTFIRNNMESLAVPPLPDKHMFASNVPVKVDSRREKLNDYFASLLYLSPLPFNPALKLAQFISTDPVMNPITGEFAKEGMLLVRKSKTLGSTTTWRIRYCTVEGSIMHLHDHMIDTDTIKLTHSTIELQANLPDDKYGTKNGFILNEHKKSGLSSSTKYYFCAETPKEREQWISVLTTLCDGPGGTAAIPSINSKSEASSLFEQTSISDSSYLGPIANLEAMDATSPTRPNDPNPVSLTSEEEKEVKRRRMKSFFPFKKLATTPTPYAAGNDNASIFSQDDDSPVNATNESGISRSLQSMNLQAQYNAVFGADLRSCLQLSSHPYQGKYEIPSVVFRTLEFLYKNRGIQEEGIFRLSGSSSLIKSLQEQFDKEYDVDLCNYNDKVSVTPGNENQGGLYVDVNTVSGLLKLYLRKLPHMIFGDAAYMDFKRIVERNGDDSKLIALEFRALVNSGRIAKEYVALMYALFELLVKITENSKYNKMNLRNLCIVFSPTLNIPVNILHPFITDFGCIFQDKAPMENGPPVNIHIPQI
ncbi:AGR230Wp [Eremothecium gossypii ATCC 10895]|uniref:GTPase-activating protein BEM3 n=1 Tax=Eremothecium gossypii (strain ATCC 10895 / CBS 109.51 / FGSC 9923 / NRRL Y-1056) TaxID=284811 RepID=BEM3_EREGS|nr:AGR230Wp [Eremothecium gossypii ATCC 10895]Q74ZH7.2 RecName: Full=GTPase-activating protein BEM3 [Eremothecium gossypii ATCC 10895]AAG41239.1 Bem3 [Eremothecium gossypii]AAS54720.2 AGR230Wp [Eremothecium gossypii ATCC 10895]AEY99051.1 FAGR230Wp [Eremothecium gossypii FDAG1]